MNFNLYGPYEIPLHLGEFDKRIDREDIQAFWEIKEVVEFGLYDACGVYIFAITSQGERCPWYVGKAAKQNFYQECFTMHKLLLYHQALDKGNREGQPCMYFLARTADSGALSKVSVNGYDDVNYVERMFIEKAYTSNNALRNSSGLRYAKKLWVQGFYNENTDEYENKSVRELYKDLYQYDPMAEHENPDAQDEHEHEHPAHDDMIVRSAAKEPIVVHIHMPADRPVLTPTARPGWWYTRGGKRPM